MNSIDFNSFITFCKTLVGQTLETVGRRSKFTLHNITDNDFYYEVSTDKIKKQGIQYVKSVLDRYEKTKSLNPGHYADITKNGAFVLALIRLFEEFNKS